MKTEEVMGIMGAHGFVLREEKAIPYGTQIIFTNGAIVCVYNSGKISVQGKQFDAVSKLLARPRHVEQVGTAHNTADDIF